MNRPAGQTQALNVERLIHLHNLTSEISRTCEKQLRTYLEALAPLFRPRRVLGDHVEGSGRESIVGADQNLAELREMYQLVAGRPFELRRELPTPLESISTQIQLYEWEYAQEVQTDRERKTITVRSPLTWVLSYPSTYSLSLLKQVLAGRQARDPESIRAFVLRACIMKLLFSKQPALHGLFEGLRYRVEFRKSHELGELPLVTVAAPLHTIRPADDLVLVATGVAGANVFEEVLDLEGARQIPDSLRDQVFGTLRAHGEDV
jgi:hypothetical protein